MNIGLDYKLAENLIQNHVTDPITRLHMRESEEIMRALARNFGEDEESWGIIGFLHDLDWDITKNDPRNHCIVVQDLLKEVGASEFLIETVVSHGYDNELIPALKDKKRSTRIQYCLAAAETLTGLIVASALVQPDKKLSSVTLESLKNKFKSKGFAARCSRDMIRECEMAGIPLDDFLELGLKTLQKMSLELGL